jgi:hypothetical protein
MKKLFIALFVIVAMITFTAQTANAQAAVTKAGNGVISGAAADTIVLPTATGGYNIIAVQATLTKTAGTAAGTIAYEGSVNGVNYVTAVASSTLTNTTTNTFVVEVPKYFQKVRVIFTSSSGTFSGTGSVSYRYLRLLTN